MSGLAAVASFDGERRLTEVLSPITSSLAHRCPDGSRVWASDTVALAYLHTAIDATDAADAQPALDETAQICLVFDGRVDNRDELLAVVGPARDELRHDSDCRLVLHTYLRWGSAGFARVVGDFALALWDGRDQQLVCARDVLGKRPLYYHYRSGLLRLASEPAALLADGSLRPQPNLGMVGEFLADAVTSRSETLLDGILRVPPAHVLVASQRGVRVERFWRWHPQPIRRRDEGEEAAELLELLTTAVGSRLPADGPVAAELSGGLDSSSVVALAARLIGMNGRASLDPFSLVFPGRDCDETDYIRAAAAHAGLTAREFEPHPLGAGFYEAELRRTAELPAPPNLAMHRPIALAARDRGCRLLLTGDGGDEWFAGSELARADALRAGRLRVLLPRLAADRRRWGTAATARGLIRYGVLPLFPAAGERLAYRVAGEPAYRGWLPARFRRSVDLDDRVRRRWPRGPNLAAADLASAFDDGWIVHVAEQRERFFAGYGLHVRSPFDDRRLIEWALASPDELRWRDGMSKWLLRSAMTGLVPDPVRTRRDKTGFRSVFRDELAALGGAGRFADLRIADLGWVDGAALEAGYEQFARGTAAVPGHEVPPRVLWNALWLDQWFRAMLREETGFGGAT